MYSTARNHVFRRLIQNVLPFCLQFVMKAESVLYSELVPVWVESLNKDHSVKPPGMPHGLWAAFKGGVTCVGGAGAGGDVLLPDKPAYWGEHCDYKNLNMSGHRF